MKKILPVVLILALAAGGWFWWHQRATVASEDLVLYGNVDIRQVALAFDGTGRITDLTVEEGDSVKAGDVIGHLDTRTLELQAKAQEATVESQRQNLLELRNGARPEEIDQANAKISVVKAAEWLANLNRERTAQLITADSGAASQRDMDRAIAIAQGAQALVEMSQSALEQLRIGTRPEVIAAAEAQLHAAEANLALLNHQIGLAELRATSDAVVRSRLREPGEIVTPQMPVYALALTDPKWVRVYVREADLGRIKPGMGAQILTDSHPDQPVAGTVGYISSVAEFTPKSVQTEELRTNLVYEVHVTVDDAANALRLGQPVTVKLAIGAAS